MVDHLRYTIHEYTIIKRISQRIETKKLFLRVFLYETHDENLQ